MCSVRGSEADTISLSTQTEVVRQMPFHCVHRSSEADIISLCAQTQVMRQMPFHCVESRSLLEGGVLPVILSCFRRGSGVFTVILLTVVSGGEVGYSL